MKGGALNPYPMSLFRGDSRVGFGWVRFESFFILFTRSVLLLDGPNQEPNPNPTQTF